MAIDPAHLEAHGQGPAATAASTPRGGEAVVRLVDLEPLAGLVAACARLSSSLTADMVKVMPDATVDAIQSIQSILWQLEHSVVEKPTTSGG